MPIVTSDRVTRLPALPQRRASAQLFAQARHAPDQTGKSLNISTVRTTSQPPQIHHVTLEPFFIPFRGPLGPSQTGN